ncbi:hypothetical protein AVEN_137520-1 [Araneus ventricosus]|uniref:Uncharacterized protein n=1 Tax=Araneus ventricosus TaxID=182803 RepID=A0A4Y2QE08_ARAVE|nr:hypothetical protein AVEN_137520-1 [Araneus ventricosus]
MASYSFPPKSTLHYVIQKHWHIPESSHEPSSLSGLEQQLHFLQPRFSLEVLSNIAQFHRSFIFGLQLIFPSQSSPAIRQQSCFLLQYPTTVFILRCTASEYRGDF